MIELKYPQRSPEWHQARCGLLTGSRVADVFAVTAKGQPAAARQNLVLELALECITGESEPVYVTQAMRDGVEREPLAREAYELHSGILMREAGLCMHGEIAVGTSPDGLTVDGVGGLEIKCPMPKTHLGYWRAGIVPSEYLHQCLHLMWVCDLEWVDFASFHPGFPGNLRLFVTRLNRADVTKDLDAHKAGCIALLAEVDAMVTDLMRLAA